MRDRRPGTGGVRPFEQCPRVSEFTERRGLDIAIIDPKVVGAERVADDQQYIGPVAAHVYASHNVRIFFVS
jgi:hypothetical protein